MTHRSLPNLRQASPEKPADRRAAPRIRAEHVPWIVSVKPSLGDSARLVDISRTGLLLETRDRLRPGHRGVMTLGLPGDRAERIESHVVRSNLVAIAPDALPIYHAAFSFSTELNPNLLDPRFLQTEAVVTAAVENASANDVSAQWSHRLDGPFDALWASECGSAIARVTNISQTSCVAYLPCRIEAGLLAALTIIFAPLRRLLLTGRVVNVRPDSSCVLRFEGLSADQRRLLRVELGSQRAEAPAAPLASSRTSSALADLSSEIWAYTAGLPINAW